MTSDRNDTPKQREERRTQSYEALTRGLDEKLLMGGTGHALELLEAAYASARSPDALSWPLPAVTAYRLAYILMRRARTEDDLARVDDLLTEAGQGETVDPLQHALHLVVIERLRDAANGPEERARLRKLSLAAFQRLRDSSRRTDVDATERPIQEDLFNLVELSGFLVGDDDYGALEGRARLSAQFLPRSQEDAFMLFGNHGVDPGVRWTRSLAEGEFCARIKEGAVDLAFEWTGIPRLVFPDSPKISSVIGRLFPDFCLSREPREVVEKNLFDVNLNRTRLAIAKILPPINGRKLKPLEVIESKSKGVHAFNSDLRVLGLVSLKHARPECKSAVSAREFGNGQYRRC
jgi:hypothetical protein